MGAQKPIADPAALRDDQRVHLGCPPCDCSVAETFLRIIADNLLPPRWACLFLLALTVVYLTPFRLG